MTADINYFVIKKYLNLFIYLQATLETAYLNIYYADNHTCYTLSLYCDTNNIFSDLIFVILNLNYIILRIFDNNDQFIYAIFIKFLLAKKKKLLTPY